MKVALMTGRIPKGPVPHIQWSPRNIGEEWLKFSPNG